MIWEYENLKLNAEALGYTMGDDRTWLNTYKGYEVMIRLHPTLGTLNGYVKATVTDIYDVECHGGITFNHDGWIGFDCAHYGDLIPQSYEMFEPLGLAVEGEVYRDMSYVNAEIEGIVEQVISWNLLK